MSPATCVSKHVTHLALWSSSLTDFSISLANTLRGSCFMV